jgi:hypothetical protein
MHEASRLVAAAVGAVLIAPGCSSRAGSSGEDNNLGLDCTSARPTFAADVAPILARNCSGDDGCHGVPRYADLVGTTLGIDMCAADRVDVDPGSLENSYLMHKLTGIDMCPMTEQMPLGGSLTASEIQTVADWICAGAPEN